MDYSGSTALGTTTTVSSNFKAGLKVTSSVSFAGSSSSISFGVALSSESESSVGVKMTAASDIKVSRPNSDVIDHDLDVFYLWLNSQIDVTFDQQAASWSLTSNGPTIDIQYVYAGWLKDPTQMPPGVATTLAAVGMTSDDYATILALDPFASGSSAIDPNRFSLAPLSFPYEPPAQQGDLPSSQTYSVTNESTSSNKTSYTTEYEVALDIKGGFEGTLWGLSVGADMDNSATWTWTDQTSQASSQTTTQSAKVTGPSFGYTGLTDIMVYWDQLYGSFLFTFVGGAGADMLYGVVTSKTGAPVPRTPVVVEIAGYKRQTYTDSTGAPRQGCTARYQVEHLTSRTRLHAPSVRREVEVVVCQ